MTKGIYGIYSFNTYFLIFTKIKRLKKEKHHSALIRCFSRTINGQR